MHTIIAQNIVTSTCMVAAANMAMTELKKKRIPFIYICDGKIVEDNKGVIAL